MYSFNVPIDIASGRSLNFVMVLPPNCSSGAHRIAKKRLREGTIDMICPAASDRRRECVLAPQLVTEDLVGRNRAITVLLCSIAAMASLVYTVAGAADIVPPSNPSSDHWAVPAYTFTPVNHHAFSANNLPVCWVWNSNESFLNRGSTRRCMSHVLEATDHAQHAEGLPDVRLPTNFDTLTVPDQLLVLVDIERISRGETPVLGVSSADNAFAQVGAENNTDPYLPPSADADGSISAWSANYAAGVNTLDANYQWMYTDGWDGRFTFNGACTSALAPGCWGHRDNILANESQMPCSSATCSIIMGAGFVRDGETGGYNSYTELFVQVITAVPPLSYTWTEALTAGASA